MEKNIKKVLSIVHAKLNEIDNNKHKGYAKIYQNGVVGIIGGDGIQNEIIIKIEDCNSEDDFLFTSGYVIKNHPPKVITQIAKEASLEYKNTYILEEVTNFMHTPRLKELTIIYVSRQYGENALFDDYHLYQEYKWLKKNNKLDELFKEENFGNRMDDENFMKNWNPIS